jgi:hypothetical protein
MTKQKFNIGDLVRIKKDLGSTKANFKLDCDAIIIGSYKDLFLYRTTPIMYTVYIRGIGVLNS